MIDYEKLMHWIDKETQFLELKEEESIKFEEYQHSRLIRHEIIALNRIKAYLESNND